MAKIGTKEASKLTGKNESTIRRASKSGALSFTLNSQGHREFEVSELERWCDGLKQQQAGSTGKDKQACAATHGQELPSMHGQEAIELQAKIDNMQVQIDALQSRLKDKETALDDMKEQRDKWEQQAERATLLLTHQPEKTAETTQPKGFWARLFRG